MKNEWWKRKNVLVTGANGFIGSAVVKELIDLESNVVCLVKDIDQASQASFFFRGLIKPRYVFGDICDFDLVRETISSYEIDVIFHFAACAIVRISARDPLTTYNTNVMGTVNVLEAARVVGKCESIVVASSDKAYGDHDVLPYIESFSLQPRNTYDTSKACMDMIARTYASNYDMPICVTRCSNVYGPGDMNLSRIVPNTIRRVLDGKSPVVYSDVENMEREFIYIDDVVDAYIRLASQLPTNKQMMSGQAYNVGGTGAVRIYDLVEKLAKITGYTDELTVVERDSSFREIMKQYIDASKLTRDTGWSADISLDEGLRLTVSWYKMYYGIVDLKR